MKRHQCCALAVFRRFLSYIVQPKVVVGPAQQLDVLDLRWDLGWQCGLRVGFGEAAEAEQLRVNLVPEIGLVAFPTAQVLDDSGEGERLLNSKELAEEHLTRVPFSGHRWGSQKSMGAVRRPG